MLVMMYSVMAALYLVYTLVSIYKDATQRVVSNSKPLTKAQPIYYPMYDEAGKPIIIEIEMEDPVIKQTKKVCDIIQGQYWVEAMQMMDIIYAVKKLDTERAVV